MTGEITIQGRVLPVGGIKEKLLAGVARGLKHAIIPYQNKKDLEEIPQELRKKIKVHTVRHYDEVINLAFVNDDANSTKSVSKEKNKETSSPNKKATKGALKDRQTQDVAH